MGGKTSAAVKNKYIAKAYDRINFVMKKGRKEEIKEKAASEGISTNKWINDAIQEKIDRGAGKASGAYTDIKDLSAYARSAGCTEDEYIRQAIAEKMQRQDEEYKEEIEREKIF